MGDDNPIQLGLCCLNTLLKKQNPPIYSSRKMIIRTIESQGIEVLKEKIIENLKDVIKMMKWNFKNNIFVFRLSSELFPHKTNPKVEDYDYDFSLKYLKKIGRISRKLKQRLTFHPGQYNVVGTPNIDFFNKTKDDLKYHADVLDFMNCDQNSVIVVHGGGLYGNKKDTINRWCKQYYELSKNVQERLVIENCEKCFSIEDCLEISNIINIPVVFDTHHFQCYKLLHPDEYLKEEEFYIPLILNTWKKRNIKPKFHISEQGSGKIGHHSDYIKQIPNYLLEIYDKYDTKIDIMIEAKMKEQAIFNLYEKYDFLNKSRQKRRVKRNHLRKKLILKSNNFEELCECC